MKCGTTSGNSKVAALLVVLAATSCGQACRSPSPQRRHEIEKLCGPIIEGLEGHRAGNGGFLDGLPREYGERLIAIEGHGQYGVEAGDESFYLTVGDYAECGWAYTYSSRSATWYYDH